ARLREQRQIQRQRKRPTSRSPEAPTPRRAVFPRCALIPKRQKQGEPIAGTSSCRTRRPRLGSMRRMPLLSSRRCGFETTSLFTKCVCAAREGSEKREGREEQRATHGCSA